MSIEILTLIMLGSMVVLLVIGLPLAFVTGIIALGFALFLYGPLALPLIASRIYGFVSVYALIAVPMFVFMASVLERSGIARDLFGAMHVLSGNLRGGLGVALQSEIGTVKVTDNRFTTAELTGQDRLCEWVL